MGSQRGSEEDPEMRALAVHSDVMGREKNISAHQLISHQLI
jgi:hypothetical protein